MPKVEGVVTLYYTQRRQLNFMSDNNETKHK